MTIIFFDKEATIHRYHVCCAAWTPVFGDAMRQLEHGYSNLQNQICQRLHCYNSWLEREIFF